jgi:hypothetical protein
MPVSAAPTVGNHGAGIRSAAETIASGPPTQRAVLKSGLVVWGQHRISSRHRPHNQVQAKSSRSPLHRTRTAEVRNSSHSGFGYFADDGNAPKIE